MNDRSLLSRSHAKAVVSISYRLPVDNGQRKGCRMRSKVSSVYPSLVCDCTPPVSFCAVVLRTRQQHPKGLLRSTAVPNSPRHGEHGLSAPEMLSRPDGISLNPLGQILKGLSCIISNNSNAI
jgi:hypothetical protein